MTKRHTASEQIEVLKDLTQSAASWLLGFRSSRSMRDAADAPRNQSGTYDARALVAWFSDRASGTVDEMGIPIAAPDSPATERWRRARALDVETKVLERLGELVAVAEVNAAVAATFVPVRQFVTRLIVDGRVSEEEWMEIIGMVEAENLKLRPPDVQRRELHILPHGEEVPIVIDLTRLSQGENI